MKSIYYQTSQGEIINLIEEPYMMLTETDLFNYSWEQVTQGENYPKIVAMKKGIVSPAFSIRVKGNSKQELLDNVEALIGAFDYDVYAGEMGRLYVGDYYRKCYIQAAQVGKIFETKSTTIQFNAISDEADWVSWHHTELSGAGNYYVGNIADRTIISANKDLRSLVIYGNEDGTLDINWVSSNGAIMTFDFGSVVEINETSDINIHVEGYEGAVPVFVVQTEISNDGSTWTQIASQSVYNGTYSWNVEDIECRYVRFILNTNSLGTVFQVSAESFEIVSNIYPSTLDNLVDFDNLNLENLEFVQSGSMIQFNLIDTTSTGYLYLDNIKHLSEIEIHIIQGNDVFVQYFVDDSWTTIASANKDLSWNWELDCTKIRVGFRGANNYFTSTSNFSLMGVLEKFVQNLSYAPSEAIVKIYGSTAKPQISIGSQMYGADVELLEGEWLEINTKEKTVRKYANEGEYDNVFNERVDSTFEKIPTGENEVNWIGYLSKIEIDLEEGRSQPKWN